MYRPHLTWALNHPRLVLGAAIVLLVFALTLVPFLGTEFLPTMDEGDIVVQPFQIPSVSLTQSLDTVARIEKAIMELPEVTRVVSRTGRSDIASDPMGVGESDTYVMLRPRSEWSTARTKEGLVDALREKLETIPGVEFGYTQPIQMRVDELISGVKSQIAVKIFGDDLGELARLGDQVAEVLRSVTGLGRRQGRSGGGARVSPNQHATPSHGATRDECGPVAADDRDRHGWTDCYHRP